MLQLGWFGLTNPWILAALVSLPVLWWLLRIIPPAPRYVRFPAIRFLLGLEPEEQTSARTPPWLLFLRLLLATLLILALGCVLAGIHLEWLFALVGLLLALILIVVSVAQQYLTIAFLLAGLAALGFAAYWVMGRRAPPDPSPPFA